MRFNAGDRIKNLSGDFMDIKSGDIVTVESYCEVDDIYTLKEADGRWYLCPEEWELVEPKVAATYPRVNCSIEIELENKSITLTIEEARMVRVLLGEVLK
jgi:hypothetical protein